jgi:hypothetical protein
MRRFIEISIPLIILLVPEFWKSAFEWLRQSHYWRYAQILMILWIVVVLTYPLTEKLAPISRIAAVAVAALIGAGLFGGIVFWLTAPKKIPDTEKTEPKHVTLQNVDALVVKWIKAFPDNFIGGKIKPLQSSKVCFGYACIFSDGRGIAVSRARDPRYERQIGLGARIDVDPEILAIYNLLTSYQKHRFVRELKVEAFRERMNFDNVDPSRGPIILNKVIPINDELTQEVFYEALTNIHSNVGILMGTIDKLLDELTTPPSPTLDRGASPP